MTEQEKKEMVAELERCKNDPVYFMEKYCWYKDHNGKLVQVNLTEAQKYLMEQIAIHGKGKIFIQSKGISGRRH